jgi:hypothetical protein
VSGEKPDFLIVGAMKGGTTTLYYDLGAHPDLHLPELKEPEILVRHTDVGDIRKAYAAHFRNARPDQFCGEASTAYTKRPDYEGVAERALAAAGPDLRILYITRDPVARAVSHFKHDRQHGKVEGTFENAIHTHARFVGYGRYAWQIAPWKAAFGDDRVMVIDLADYAASRRETLEAILRFIGADPARLNPIDADARANSSSEQKTIENPLLRNIIFSEVYQRRMKQFIPRGLREKVRRTILPPPPDDRIEVPSDLRSYILENASN